MFGWLKKTFGPATYKSITVRDVNHPHKHFYRLNMGQELSALGYYLFQCEANYCEHYYLIEKSKFHA